MSRQKNFFLNGNLHRVLHENRAKDMITAYDMVEEQVKVYPGSEVRKRSQNAFTITEAAKIVGRHRDRIKVYMLDGSIEKPQREHNPETKKPGRYFFSEDDMMALRDFMATLHIGRPRKDGRTTNNRVPTREELRAMVQGGRIMYVKENDEFVPIWRAKDW